VSLPIVNGTLPEVLLAEPDLLLRRAVVKVAGEMGLAHVHPASDVHAAVPLMEAHAFDAIVIALDREGDAIELLTLLRCGQYRSTAVTPVAVVAGPAQGSPADRLTSLDVHEMPRASCTVRRMLDTIGMLLSVPAPAASLQKK
jgi:hypothetical protein